MINKKQLTGEKTISSNSNMFDTSIKEDKTIKDMSSLIRKTNKFDQSLYPKHDVKRGLRNADGSGVLVGLTKVGNVRGYFQVDNEKKDIDGTLKYRGINVYDLVKDFQKSGRFGFEEVSYLLISGELPNESELIEFKQVLAQLRVIPEGFLDTVLLRSPSNNIMNKLARSVLTIYSYDRYAENRSLQNILIQGLRLIALFPVIIAYGYQSKSHYYDKKSLYIHNPKNDKSIAEIFLSLIRPDEKYTKIEAEILDLSLILHAEHGGGNNSTFTTHLVASSDTDIYSTIAAAIGSLKGLRHGGANFKVIEMMNNIKDNVKDITNEKQVRDYLIKIVQKKTYDKTGLIYGLGHAVYTKSDPREIILHKKAASLAKEKKLEEDFNLHEIVQRLGPEVFAEVKKSNKMISANVDFYSGFVYRALDIPVDLYTPIFAMSRISGWIGHVLEERISGRRIMRPAYKSISKDMDYVSLKDRP